MCGKLEYVFLKVWFFRLLIFLNIVSVGAGLNLATFLELECGRWDGISTATKFCGTKIGRRLGLTNGTMSGMGGGPLPSPSWAMVTGMSTPISLLMSIATSSLTLLVTNDVSLLNLKGVASSPSWVSTSKFSNNTFYSISCLLAVRSTFEQYSIVTFISSITLLILDICSYVRSFFGLNSNSSLWDRVLPCISCTFDQFSLDQARTLDHPWHLYSFNIFICLGMK